jgi:hypothetical protein
MYSKGRLLRVFRRIVKTRKVDVTQCAQYCYVIYCHLCRQYVFAEKQARNAHQRLLIGSVIVSVLGLSAVDRGFKSRSGQTKDYKLVFVAYNTKHAVLKRKNKDWLARNQDNVSEWSDMYIRGLLFQWANTMKKPN